MGKGYNPYRGAGGRFTTREKALPGPGGFGVKQAQAVKDVQTYVTTGKRAKGWKSPRGRPMKGVIAVGAGSVSGVKRDPFTEIALPSRLRTGKTARDRAAGIPGGRKGKV